MKTAAPAASPGRWHNVMFQRRFVRWDGWRSIFRVLLFLVILVIFGPFLIQFMYVGEHGARRASCQSNLKQLGLAMTQYEQDSDNVLPPVTSRGNGWREEIFPYTKATGVYQCPSDKRGGEAYTSTNLPRSYAANHLGPDGKGQERGACSGLGEAPVTLFQLDHPESTILLADTRGDQNEEWNMVSSAFLPQPQSNRELFVHVSEHLFYEKTVGGLNVLLADGHVKSRQPMNTLTPINLWTRDNAPFTGQDLSNAQAILKYAEDE